MIYIIRHGQTDDNANGVTSGRKNNIGINDVGNEQAKQMREKLRNIKFDAAFCSPLLRTRMTCDIVIAPHGIQYVIDEKLNEREFGEFNLLINEEYDRKSLWNYNLNKFYETCENVRDMYNRAVDFISMLQQNYKGKNVLVVTHGGIGMMFNAYFNGLPEDGDLLKLVIKHNTIIQYDL